VDAKADKQANERDRKFAECLDTLKRLYPGVHGKMTDLVKTTQAKVILFVMTLLITVAMGGNMDAVIVDNEKTAIECVQVLTLNSTHT
jgi:structural maintenance of chromosome 1